MQIKINLEEDNDMLAIGDENFDNYRTNNPKRIAISSLCEDIDFI
jgi:hypothetical protein